VDERRVAGFYRIPIPLAVISNRCEGMHHAGSGDIMVSKTVAFPMELITLWNRHLL
jgi:hypothetical protein